jgi:hypothetical protein
LYHGLSHHIQRLVRIQHGALTTLHAHRCQACICDLTIWRPPVSSIHTKRESIVAKQAYEVDDFVRKE